MTMYVDPKNSYRDEASKASKKAVELDPSLAEAHASRGLACLICEDFAMAETEFEQALELNPGLFEAYYYYGRARFHQGDMEGAAELFEKAAKANPADYQSRLLRVQVLRGMGRYDEALEEAKLSVAAVEKHIEWNPDDARALHLGAGSLVVLGDIERAEKWLQRALEIDPNDSVVLYNVACNYATLAQTGKALDYLEQAIEHGTVSASWMKNDEDLVSLHGLPRYREMLAKLEQKNYN
jgi:adenylate cyclase